MNIIFLVILIIGYCIMTLIFLFSVRGSAKKSKWLGLAAILFAAPFFFWLGTFTEQFYSGQCYSHSIELIASAVANTNSPLELANEIRALPLYGYETVCVEVEAASKKLPNVVVP